MAHLSNLGDILSKQDNVVASGLGAVTFGDHYKIQLRVTSALEAEEDMRQVLKGEEFKGQRR